MTYVGSYGLPGGNINEYTNADGTLSVGYFSDIGDLAQIIYSETTFHSIPDGITTETEYHKWVESYIASQTKDENLSKYTYSCSTTYMEYGEDYAESVTKDYFYAPAAASEHSYMYTFSYTTKVSGYDTYDEISVIILPSGNAIFPQPGVFSISFSRHNFDDLSSVNISNEKVAKTVDYQLDSALKSDEYDVKTFNIQKSTLYFENGTLYLTCLVNVELEYIGDELYEDEAEDEPVIIETMEYFTMVIPEDCYKMGD